MALDPRVLCNLADVKLELAITVATFDARLERLITVATDLIESDCDRKFAYEAGIVEKVRTYGTPFLAVERRPIVSVTSIVELGTALLATDYEVVKDPKTGRNDSGLIARRASDYSLKNWPWTAARRPDIEQDKLPGTEAWGVTVTYAGGFVTAEQKSQDPGLPARSLPYDLEQAAIELVVSLYRTGGEDRNVSLEQVGDGQQSWGHGRNVIPEAIRRMLDPYRAVAGA